MTAALRRLGRGGRRIGRALFRLVRMWPGWVGAAVVLAATVAVVATWGTSEPGRSDLAGTPTGRVGVSDGDSVPAYVSAQQAELARLAATRPDTSGFALVSFAAYLTPVEVAAASAGVTTVAGYARAPLPGQQTELIRLPASRVPGDLTFGINEAAERKTTEAARYRIQAAQAAALIGSVDAGADQARLAFFADVASREADALRSGKGCVYALVVWATPAELTVVAGRAGVRVVDPAPEVEDVARGVFVAPLPDQADRVQPLPGGLAP